MLATRSCAGIALAAAVAACASGDSDDSAPRASPDEASPHVEVIGVAPANFECESIATEANVSAIVGEDVTVARSKFDPPRGVTHPCIYAMSRYGRDSDAGLAQARHWSVDFDCRKSAIDDGQRLMAQYASEKDAQPVRIGRSGIDREPALLFIHDDAPCYVRVVGPQRRLRIELAQLVAENLTSKNAPMTPVYRQLQAGAAE